MSSETEPGWRSLNALLVLASAALWGASNAMNTYLMSFADFARGIDLIYLPAGFRLLIVLLFGFWGALGIFLSNPIAYLVEFGSGSASLVIANSLICAFCRAAGIQASLLQLKPVHLPLLALAVSVATPVMLNLFFLASGMKEADQLMVNVSAMVTGDFLGCLFLIVLVRLAIAAVRVVVPSQTSREP